MRLVPALLLAVLTLVGVAGAAVATTQPEDRPLEIRVEQVVADADGTTSMTVVISGLDEGESVDLSNLEIVENGEVVEDVRLADQEELETESVVPAVVVAMDVSGSTAGPLLEAATSAAADLLRSVGERGGLVGVVSFGPTTQIVVPLGEDADQAAAGVTALSGGGETALYDGVSRAARMLLQHEGPRDVVVFSDGSDTASGSSLDNVRGLLAEAEVRVSSVLLQSEEVDVAPLQAMAAVNGGQFIEVAEAAELESAFAAVAADLTNRVRVLWEAEPVPDPASTLNVVATYQTEEASASDGAQVDSPRLAAVAPPREVEPPSIAVPALGGRTGRVVATAATGLAVLLLLFLVLVGTGERRRQRTIDERLSAYQPSVGEHGREDRVSLSDRASSAFDVIPRPRNLDARIATAIEQADWPLRVGEFVLISLGTGVLGMLVGGVLLESLAVAIIGLAFGLAAPWGYLKIAVSRRRAAFADQLPTVLQVLAGALRAGHAFSTALDGAVDEIDEPAKSEFRRASVEARLGRPMDRALEGVAQRMDSTDLQWVIGALEVQREVGGNLAEILGNVAATLRDRASIARHVKSLTAEGRLSATIITIMPFAMFAFLAITNPDYLRPLYSEPIGRFMLGSGLVLLVIGVFVLRRLVRPKY